MSLIIIEDYLDRLGYNNCKVLIPFNFIFKVITNEKIISYFFPQYLCVLMSLKHYLDYFWYCLK